MSGFEISETMEAAESFSINEIQEERDQLRLQVDAAQEAGNVEKANYFLGEIAKLEEQLTQLGTDEEAGETTLGKGFARGHSGDYWQEEMVKEYAQYGKTPYYYICKKNYGAATLNA